MKPTLPTIKFDGSISGDQSLVDATTFTRNAVTYDKGVSVPVGTPIYGKSVQASPTLSVQQTIVGSVFGSGFDHDGVTPLMCHLNSGGGIGIRRENLLNVVYSATPVNGSSDPDIMEGTVAGFRFSLPYWEGQTSSSISVTHGLICLLCLRIDTSDDEVKGIAIAYTQDLGATWNILEDTDGNQTFPTTNAGNMRGTLAFALGQGFPENSEALAFRIGVCDYQSKVGTYGFQAGMFRINRETINDPWTVNKARLIDSDAAAVAHSHNCYPIKGDGYGGLVIAIGDSQNNRTQLHWWTETSSNSYLTATINNNRTWIGKAKADTVGGNGSMGSQFVGSVPGPDGSALVSGDVVFEVVGKIYPPTGDPSTFGSQNGKLLGLVTRPNSENFSITVRDSINLRGYAVLGKLTGALSNAGTTVTQLFMSEDGENWGLVSTGFDSYFQESGGWFGDYFCVRSEAEVITAYSYKASAPTQGIIVGPGNNNRLAADWVESNAPAGAITVEKIEKVDGVYVYPTGHPLAGQELPEQPPGPGAVYQIKNVGAERDGGEWDLVGSAIPGLTGQQGTIQLAILPLEGGVASYVNTGSRPTRTDDHRIRISNTQSWTHFVTRGAFDSDNFIMGIDCTSTASSNVRSEDWWLLQVVNAMVGEVEPSVPLPLATDNTNTRSQVVIGPVTVTDSWAFFFEAKLPEEINGTTFPVCLGTWLRNGSNALEVWLQDATTVRVDTYLNGARRTNTTATITAVDPGSIIRVLAKRNSEFNATVYISAGPDTSIATITAADLSDNFDYTLRLSGDRSNTNEAKMEVLRAAISTAEALTNPALELMSYEPFVEPEVATDDTKLDTLLERIDYGAAQLFEDLANMIVDSGTATPQFTADSLGLVPFPETTGTATVYGPVNDSSDDSPIANAVVWLTTTTSSTPTVREALTDSLGNATFYNLAAGTYYVWVAKDGFTFANPDTLVVS
jgi:hypothetical protein